MNSWNRAGALALCQVAHNAITLRASRQAWALYVLGQSDHSWSPRAVHATHAQCYHRTGGARTCKCARQPHAWCPTPSPGVTVRSTATKHAELASCGCPDSHPSWQLSPEATHHTTTASCPTHANVWAVCGMWGCVWHAGSRPAGVGRLRHTTLHQHTTPATLPQPGAQHTSMCQLRVACAPDTWRSGPPPGSLTSMRPRGRARPLGATATKHVEHASCGCTDMQANMLTCTSWQASPPMRHTTLPHYHTQLPNTRVHYAGPRP